MAESGERVCVHGKQIIGPLSRALTTLNDFDFGLVPRFRSHELKLVTHTHIGHWFAMLF